MWADSAQTVPHAQWAVGLLIGLEEAVTVEGAVGTRRGRVLVVPAGLEHVTRSRGPCLSILLDPDEHRGALLEARRGRPFAVSEPGLVSLAAALAQQSRVGDVEGTARRLASYVLPSDPAPIEDPRLTRLVSHLKARDVEDEASLGMLAAELGLSPTYLSTLFHEKVGLPLRRWLLWRRLIRAVQGFRPGNLAEVAHSAGFADQAHLTRTCGRMLGYTPRVLAELRKAQLLQDWPEEPRRNPR